MTLVLITFMMFPLGPSQADLEFQRSMEEFVIRASPGHEIPQPYRTMIQNLGCEFWLNREGAARLLEARIKPNVRWLFWARKNRDLEIAMRANVLLAKLYRCRVCWGAGECLDFQVMKVTQHGWEHAVCARCQRDDWQHGNERQPCDACGGTGTAWNRGIFE